MKICIIGAGISGLSAARLLMNNHEITVFEKEDVVGGIAKTIDVGGAAYHKVGGHCFNSKNKKVLDFVFEEILPKDQWHLVERKAKINFKGKLISYPIEYAINEISQFDPKLAYNMTKDFLSSQGKDAGNLAEWFKQNFGETLALEYFIPYNEKIWQLNLKKMSPAWVDGKLPTPNKYNFFMGLLKKKKDKMSHSTFYYPNSNNQNVFISALGKDVDVNFNEEVFRIEKVGKEWLVNSQYKFDIIINTMPLNILPFVLHQVPDSVIESAKKLKYNKVTTVLWKTENLNHTWTYYPSAETIFHRHIHIGNFFLPKTNHTITECIGEKSFEKMVKEGMNEKYLLEPIAYNVSDHAYVLFDENYDASTLKIKSYLNRLGIHTLGRFGEWEYYNMDICIEKAMELSEKINKLGQNNG